MRKKIMILLTMFSLLLTICGCRELFPKDSKHATVSIILSTGEAFVEQSFNETNATISGKDLAIREKTKIRLNEGDTAKITFKCDECGDIQIVEVSEPYADVLSCKCSEKFDKNGNAREYYAIAISYKEEEKEKTEGKH